MSPEALIPEASSEAARYPCLCNYRMTVRYDGRGYLGWQRNGDQPTLQRALEEAVRAAFAIHQPVRAAGRTDRGVHADGQVISVFLPSSVNPVDVQRALNDALPADIRVLAAARVADDFHACTSAVGKQYRYVIWNHPACPRERVGQVWHITDALDVDAMRLACRHLVGAHDFASFAKKPNFKRSSTVRRIDDVELVHQAPEIVVRVRADGFLYKMVRNLVRALVKVGEGRHSADELRAILAARDRRAAPGTAPPTGLFLEAVYYADDPPPR